MGKKGNDVRVVLVTGGAGLIGKTICESIIKDGNVAIIGDNNSERGLQIENELKNRIKNVRCKFLELDITSNNSIQECIKKILDNFGKIDALINNAYPRNKNYGRHFFDVQYNDFCDNINMHLGGYFLMCQQLSKFFIDQGYGNIINIASIYGVIPPKFEIYEGTNMTVPIEYALIKSAIIHLTKYLSKYLKGKNIRVNAISPGGIFDNQPDKFLENYKRNTINKGMLDAGDLIGVVKFLLSDESKFINGQNIIVDDGFTL